MKATASLGEKVIRVEFQLTILKLVYCRTVKNKIICFE